MIAFVGALAIWYGAKRFNATFPTDLMCEKVVSTPDEAIRLAAKMITAWPADKENLLGQSSVADYIANFGNCCSATKSKSVGNNWMVTIILPTRCGDSIENGFQVNACGGRSWDLGSTPSRNLSSERGSSQGACD
jgi:hypothetical protein